MNITELLNQDLQVMTEKCRKYPQLQLAIANCQQSVRQSNFKSTIALLQLIAQTNNKKLLLHGISLVQKLSSAQALNVADFNEIIEFMNQARTVNEDTLQIKLVSTLLHIINPNVIDLASKDSLIQIIQLFLSFYISDNPIIQQSALQGIVTVINSFETELNSNPGAMEQTYHDLLEIFLAMVQEQQYESAQLQSTALLCKDIFIMLMKCGSQLNSIRLKQFYHERVYDYLVGIDLSVELNNLQGNKSLIVAINKLRLIFSYIYLFQSRLELISKVMQYYSKLQPFDVMKIPIHDGLMYLYSNNNVLIQMFMQSPTLATYKDYNEVILKIVYESTVSQLKEFTIQQSPKQQNLINQTTVSCFEIAPKAVPLHFFAQIRLLLLRVADTLSKLNANDFECFSRASTPDLQTTQQNQRKTVEMDEILTIQTMEYDNEDSGRVKTIIEGLWKPLIRILKHLLKVVKGEQYLELLEMVNGWIVMCYKCGHYRSFEQLIRFIAQQASPQSLKYSASDKWLMAGTVLSQHLQRYSEQLSAKTFNVIFQTFQRIEQVVTKDTVQPYIQEYFEKSTTYSDAVVLNMFDGLNQLALQISERLQISNRQQQLDSVFKSFAFDKLIILTVHNWHRVQLFWQVVDALMLCLCASKVMEIRLHAMNTLKVIIFSGFEHFSKNPSIWGDQWSAQLMNPVTELAHSQFDDVNENVMHLINSMIKTIPTYIDQQGYFIIIRLMEQIITDLVSSAEQFYNVTDSNPAIGKSLYLRLVLIVNCLTDISFNSLDQIDQPSLMRLSSLVVMLNHQDSLSKDLNNKVICMAWQVEDRMLRTGIKNPELLNNCLTFIKEAFEGSDDLRLSAMHIAAQFCISSTGDLFQQCYDVFEEISQIVLTSYLKMEHIELQVIQQTPRFMHPLQETPKFVNNRQQLFPDRGTQQQFQQLMELCKIALIKTVEILISKDMLHSFIYYFQLYNQGQLMMFKYEVVKQCAKVVNVYSDNELNDSIIDYCQNLLSISERDNFEECQFYMDNNVINFISQIVLKTYEQNQQRSFNLLRYLLIFPSQDSLLIQDNNIYKYLLKECLPQFRFTTDDITMWLNFINELLKDINIKPKYQQLIDFLLNAFINIINKSDTLLPFIEQCKQVIAMMVHCYQQTYHQYHNDNAQLLQSLITNMLRLLILRIGPVVEISVIATIAKQLIVKQVDLCQNDLDKVQEWIMFFYNTLLYQIDQKSQTILIDQLAVYYNEQLLNVNIKQLQNIILNLICLANQLHNNEELIITIRTILIKAIHTYLAEFISNDNMFSTELQLNLRTILSYINQQSIELIEQLYSMLIQLIRLESLEIRLILISILSKFQK